MCASRGGRQRSHLRRDAHVLAQLGLDRGEVHLGGRDDDLVCRRDGTAVERLEQLLHVGSGQARTSATRAVWVAVRRSRRGATHRRLCRRRGVGLEISAHKELAPVGAERGHATGDGASHRCHSERQCVRRGRACTKRAAWKQIPIRSGPRTRCHARMPFPRGRSAHDTTALTPPAASCRRQLLHAPCLILPSLLRRRLRHHHHDVGPAPGRGGDDQPPTQ